VQICLCHVNVAIDLPGLPQIPAPVTDQSCAATSSANTLIGVGCPHAPPSCANLHSARRSRRHRLPFPAGSFIEGFRTPATVQAASLPSAGIRNPQQQATSPFRREKGRVFNRAARPAAIWWQGKRLGLPRRPSPIVNPALSRSLSCQIIACFSRNAVWGFRCGASEFILTTLLAPFNYPARLLST
jgi:hypothetical protein